MSAVTLSEPQSIPASSERLHGPPDAMAGPFPEHRPRSAFQKRIDRLCREKFDLERRAQAVEAQLAERDKQISGMQREGEQLVAVLEKYREIVNQYKAVLRKRVRNAGR